MGRLAGKRAVIIGAASASAKTDALSVMSHSAA